MRHSTPAPNKHDQQRFERIREIGCIACRMRDTWRTTPEIHHLSKTGRHGGKRRGHRFTVGLCQWHHRGIPLPREMLPMFASDCEYIQGPSLARQPRAFRETFGEDGPLLEYQDNLLRLNFGDGAAPPIEEE